MEGLHCLSRSVNVHEHKHREHMNMSCDPKLYRKSPP